MFLVFICIIWKGKKTKCAFYTPINSFWYTVYDCCCHKLLYCSSYVAIWKLWNPGWLSLWPSRFHTKKFKLKINIPFPWQFWKVNSSKSYYFAHHVGLSLCISPLQWSTYMMHDFQPRSELMCYKLELHVVTRHFHMNLFVQVDMSLRLLKAGKHVLQGELCSLSLVFPNRPPSLYRSAI